MKTCTAIAFLAALVALIITPFGFELASSLLFAAGLGCVAISDYTRRPRVLTPRLAPLVNFPGQKSVRARSLELAA